jgi:fructokinase
VIVTAISDLSESTVPIAGVELGGTKCVCTLALGPDDIIHQTTIPTTDPDETLGAIRRVLRLWWRERGFRAIGIASFGPICLDPASPLYGHILDTNKPHWSGVDVVGALSGEFSVACVVDTDVNAAALAEMAWGSGRGLADFSYVTVGTGVGVGLIVNGMATRGLLHGELGHMVIPRTPGDDFPSLCRFHDCCVEGLASGSAIKSRLGIERITDVAPDHPVWDIVVNALAALCHNMVCTTGPRRIAFGGGVMNRQPHLIARIEARLEQSLAGYMRLPTDRPYIVAPELADQAGPLGSIILGIAAYADAAMPPLDIAAE